VNGTPVFIRNIGTAADSSAIQTSIVRVNGRESVYIPVTKQEGANTLAVADFKIKKLTYKRLAKVWAENPDVIAKQDVNVAQATYEGVKHQMEQRQALRDYTKVRAPFAGIITARFADPRALIQVATSSATSAISLFTLMDIETVPIYANVPQEDAHLVKPGSTDEVLIVKELGRRTISGTVTRSTFALDPSTRSLLVEVDLPNPDYALQPGTFGELVLLLNKKSNALVLPPLQHRLDRQRQDRVPRRSGTGEERVDQGRHHGRQVDRDYRRPYGQRRGRGGRQQQVDGWNSAEPVTQESAGGQTGDAAVRTAIVGKSAGSTDTVDRSSAIRSHECSIP